MMRALPHIHAAPPPPRGRRIAVAAMLALCLLPAGLLSHGARDAEARPASRPNIILITTDDQVLSQLRGKYMPKTFKQIARKGTNFTSAIVTTPLCCPSRASMLTGQYAHNHEVLQNAYGLLTDKGNVLPTWLQRAGYRTAHVGKFLNGYAAAVTDPAEVAPGWDIWFTTMGSTRYHDYDVSANGRRKHFGSGRRSHVTRVIGRKAETLARRYTPDSRPLYLQVDHRAPHTETGVNSGGRCGGRAIPEKDTDTKRLRGEPLPATPSFNETDVSDKPSYVRGRPLLSGGRVRKITKRYQCGLASLRSVDRGVKRIIKALKDTHELNSTVIAFISDNGFYFGEHRIARDKTHPYEEGIRVPLLIRAPKRYLGGATPVPKVHETVGNIDLAPTFLELARGQPCDGGGDCRVMDGRSLVPLLRGGGGWPADRVLLVEYDGASSKGSSSCKYQGIRAAGRFYVEHKSIPDPVSGDCTEADENELYQLTTDPYQLFNLAPIDSSLVGVMQARLHSLTNCAGIPGRDPVPASSYCE